MKKLPNGHYSYRVLWSEDDREYAGLCAEFPSLSWLDASPEEALRRIRNIVADTVDDLKKNNEPIPDVQTSPPAPLRPARGKRFAILSG